MRTPSIQTLAQVCLITLCGGFGVLPGCSDSESPPPGVPFPNEVGSRWVYLAYDSLDSKADTVTVEIVDKKAIQTTSGTQLAAVWLSTSFDGEAWEYVWTIGDTVEIGGGDKDGVQYLEFRYVFPLTVGKEWKGSICGQAQVTEEQVVEVPGLGYRKAFLLTHDGGCLNDYFHETREFVPEVGLVSASWNWFGFSRRKETWKLAQFQLAHPVANSSLPGTLAP